MRKLFTTAAAVVVLRARASDGCDEEELNRDYGNKLRYFREVFAKFVFRSD